MCKNISQRNCAMKRLKNAILVPSSEEIKLMPAMYFWSKLKFRSFSIFNVNIHIYY